MQMKAEFDRIKADTVPVDCHGKEGDVVFYYERLGHHAVRLQQQSVLACDF